MKSAIYMCFVLGAVSLWAAEAFPVDKIDQEIQEKIIQPQPGEIDTSWVTDEIRAEIVDRMLQRIKNRPPAEALFFKSEEVVLLQLNHVETIQRLIGVILRGESASVACLQASATTEAFPYFIAALDSASPVTPPQADYGDVLVSSPRKMLASAMLMNIFKNNKFPERTRDWARSFAVVFGTKSDDQMLLLKKWWEMNREPITRGRCADATWLPMYKGQPSTGREELIDGREKSAENGSKGKKMPVAN